MRYILDKAKDNPNGWVCADLKYIIGFTFTGCDFNGTQEFTTFDDNPQSLSANELAQAARELGVWLSSNAPEGITVESLERLCFGTWITRIREGKGLRQEDIASLAGITQNNLSRIEQGKYSPGYDVLQRIAKALGGNLEIVIP